MTIFDTILNCIGLIILAVGIVCVYDARKITHKFFSTSDINESTGIVKIVGAVVSVVGSIIIFV